MDSKRATVARQPSSGKREQLVGLRMRIEGVWAPRPVSLYPVSANSAYSNR
jgi:hypothetical protein